MDTGQTEDFGSTLQSGLRCTCPKCHKGRLFRDGLMNFNLREKCDSCGLDFSKNDSADGPAVFLIFILGFSIVPLALALEFGLEPPLWVHIALWPALVLGLILGTLKPLKSYVITLQYKHRPGDWA